MDTYEPHPTVMWELTRACDLNCRGCPTGADARRGPNELSTYEAYKTIDQIAALKPRELIITGGDPLERADVGQIIDYARRRGLEPALVLSPTSQLTYEALAHLQRDGLTQVIFPIDGSTAEIHESVHAVPHTWAHLLRAMRWADCAGLLIEVNTLVCRRNAGDLLAIADLIRPFGLARWNLHFLVPAGPSKHIEMLTAAETEAMFGVIDDIRVAEKFAVRMIEAPHYRRWRLQRSLREKLRSVEEWPDFATYQADDNARDLHDCTREGARGFVFISHAGDVRPAEFAPQSAGNLRYRSLGTIYRGSDLFVALRDLDNLKGKCRRCDFRHICGGSRARAAAMTGDLFGTDPLCMYEPPGGASA
jgi:radical SAM protein with 4Fe4S-binding SPASM domain